MNIKNKINRFIFEYLSEEKAHIFYYRAINKYRGNEIVFHPKGYYEATDNQGNPIIFKGDVWMRSEIPELTASKTVGGAVLGLWSMGNHHGLNIKNAFIYKINEKPEKDLSHVKMDDFEWLKEVRYKRPVKGIYIGKFEYTKEFNDSAINFYERLNQDPWDEDTVIDIEDWESFERMIYTLNKNHLK